MNQDLSNEYSYEFSGIELCVTDRRDTACVTLAIRLSKYLAHFTICFPSRAQNYSAS